MEDERPTTMHSVVAAAEHELLPAGTDVGGYVIDAELGHGGMGVVYRATHPVIGKQVAIKVLRREMAQNPATVERFVQEARSVNQIGHPNIVDIFAFGALPDGRPYLTMDLLLGESLRERLKRGPLHTSEAASVVDETASALSAAHDKGFIHRDLKPDNVFLCAREGRWAEVKLLDFGLAKLISSGPVGSPIRTHTGILLGTPDYIAPEAIKRRADVDHRVDVYALGVMAFESLTGRRPFPAAGGSFERMMEISETPAPEIASMAPHLPKDLAYLIDAMLLKDPEGRPSLRDVRAAIKRLRAVLPSQSIAAMEVALPERVPMGVSLGGLTASKVGAEPLVPEMPVVKRTVTGAPGANLRPVTPPPVLLQAAPAIALRLPTAPPHPVTHVGVPPPVRATTLESEPAPLAMPAPVVEVKRTNPLWLGLGALVAIGAGIAIALAVMH